MKKNISTQIIAAATLLTLAACMKDDPFVFNAGEGAIDCGALTVDYVNSKNPSRAADVDVADFTVDFRNTTTNTIEKTYTYRDMPEVVSLPKGNYRVEASFGVDPIADWESPYYLGNSTFKIEANKITEDVEPVTCKLSNICVSVNISDLGEGIVDDDAKVEVEAGTGSLTFHKNTTDSGYFRYIDGSQTITATFSGTVNGNKVYGVPQIYDKGVKAGNHYSINFTITTPDNAAPGDIEINNGIIHIDTKISIKDETKEVNPGESDPDPIVDDMRPVDGSDQQVDPTPDDPTPVDPTPDDDVPNDKGNPVISSSDFEIGIPYVIHDDSPCAFSVISNHPYGFKEFTVDIISQGLTPDELSRVGLASHLDLIRPDGSTSPIPDPDDEDLNHMAEALDGLGFPIYLSGETEAHFDISDFTKLLVAFSGDHKFVLKVKDTNGTSTGTIILRVEGSGE